MSDGGAPFSGRARFDERGDKAGAERAAAL